MNENAVRCNRMQQFSTGRSLEILLPYTSPYVARL
ncbi:hypothetical protein [Sporisorium scitamineum]|uniref:Uncharacterized protein n=1 Tax=Sporisorium scitamineum TaxID=49012 RepID=A0A0F7RY58_9BASI|nr:hypothetical protein [Sporisorium scitamineum]